MIRTARLRAFLAMAALVAVMTPHAGHGQDRPAKRIVSLNMCTDELLLRLADRDQIASVTWLSQDRRNANLADEAAGFPANHGLAEEVMRLAPDLVLAGRYTTRTTTSVLKRMGVRVVEFGVPQTLPEVEDQIRSFSALVGHPARGDAMVADMRARLGALAAPPGSMRPGAFVLRPNGFTASRGSLVDDILTRAGLDNLAARLDLGNYGQVPLETVILQGTELLVVDDDREGPPSLATILLRHPAITSLRREIATVSVPGKLWTCAGPSVVDAIELLEAATRELRRRGAS